MAVSVLNQRERLGISPGQLFINGNWVQASGGQTWTHIHPATNEEITTIAVAEAEDVAAAVAAARTAFDSGPWGRMAARYEPSGSVA